MVSDMLFLPDGSTYHLGIKKGDVHSRILTVGPKARAERIAKLLDKDKPLKTLGSERMFYVYSGSYKGVGVTIIAIGMGAPMMDFMIREVSFVHPGPLAVIRFGSCGILNKTSKPGDILVASKGSIFVNVNYCFHHGCILKDSSKDLEKHPYLISGAVPCSSRLNDLLVSSLKAAPQITVQEGLNACAETFYSCQGREDPNFNDLNSHLIDTLKEYGADFLEMESHQLLFLAKRRKQVCHAAAAAVGICHRTDEDAVGHVSPEQLEISEIEGGRACLEALIAFSL